MVLNIQNLNLFFQGKNQELQALRNVSFQLDQSEVLGVVGESGSGKSITNLAIMGLLPSQSRIVADQMAFQNLDLRNLSDSEWRKVRGNQIAMIFQDPMSALNPLLTIQTQICETLRAHLGLTQHEADQKAKDLLHQVGISSPEKRLKMYPFELSGGMSQRVMIAMAISCSPKILIADEPTTALDVTIQKQILDLIGFLKDQNKMSVILVTHDLALVSQYADRIQVMYAGEIVETGQAQDLLNSYSHPYTKGLLSSRPHHAQFRERLKTIAGLVPALKERPPGCQFATRCEFKRPECDQSTPLLRQQKHSQAACLYPISKGAEHA